MTAELRHQLSEKNALPFKVALDPVARWRKRSET